MIFVIICSLNFYFLLYLCVMSIKNWFSDTIEVIFKADSNVKKHIFDFIISSKNIHKNGKNNQNYIGYFGDNLWNCGQQK